MKHHFIRTLPLIAVVALLFGLIPAQADALEGSDRAILGEQAREIEVLQEEVAKLKDAKATRPDMGYDHGFFIRSKDGDYAFRVRFFSQIFYEFEHVEGGPDVNTFGIRRARLMLSGNVFTPNLTYMIMPEMVTQYSTRTTTTNTTYTLVDSGGDTATFTDTDSYSDANDHDFRLLSLWAQYRFADEFQIRVGEFIPPTEFFFRAANLLPFGDYPIIATDSPFTPGYQTGIAFLGTLSKQLDYELFAVNGSNFDRLNLNKSFRLGLMLTYNILGQPGLGVSDVDFSESPTLALTLSGTYERADRTVLGAANINRGDDVVRGQANAILRYQGFSVAPEFIVFYNNTQHYRHYAIAGQMGYFIVPKRFEIVGQGNYLRYAGDQNDKYEFSGGFNYYFFGKPVKMQLDYSYLLNRMPGSDQNDHRVRLGAQVGFF